MRQRVSRVAGTLAIESEPGVGTAISARVPINAVMLSVCSPSATVACITSSAAPSSPRSR